MPSFLPKTVTEVRPRMAVELRPEGVYAAAADDAAGLLARVARVELASGAIVPSLRPGNIVDRVAVAGALRGVVTALGDVRGRDVTVIVPDSAVRVLLLDFDTLPSDIDDALPVVKFRLAKLLPFSPDAAQVSFQRMSQHSRMLQVLAVAIPLEVLEEYESVVREAGLEPGAVLPSTLAVAAALDDAAQTAALLVNGSEFAVTTAIVRRGELLLHRTLELKMEPMADAAAAVMLEPATVAVAAQGDPVAAAEQLQQMVEHGIRDRDRAAMELMQAISVAAAYYEDSLAVAPEEILTAGTLSIDTLNGMLAESGLRARDVVTSADLLATAVTGNIPRGLLAGLRGALKG